MTITPDVRTELLAMLRAELAQEEQRKQDNKTVYRRLCKEFKEPEMREFVESVLGLMKSIKCGESDNPPS